MPLGSPRATSTPILALVTQNPPSRRQAISLAGYTGVSLGLIEWYAAGGLGETGPQQQAARVVLAILVMYGGIGWVGGAILAWYPRRPLQAATVVATSAAALCLLTALLRLGHFGLPLVASISFAVLVFLVVRGLAEFTILRRVARPAIFTVLATALAATAWHPTDQLGALLALGGAAVALGLAWMQRTGTRVLATSILIACAAFAAMRDATPEPPSAESDQPSVLLVTIDTLRADHVGAYGHRTARTPNMDGLAADGALFRQTIAPNVLTGPSHASILTGLLPENHTALLNMMRIPASVDTLADHLGEAGYATAAFVSGFTVLDHACGLPSRFAVADDDLREFRWLPDSAYQLLFPYCLRKILERSGTDFSPMYRQAQGTTDEAVAWLDGHAGSPHFTWVHYYDPHLPYRPPEEFITDDDRDVSGRWYGLTRRQRAEVIGSRSKMADMISLYDAEIAYVDHQLGRLLEAAERAAPNGELLVIVTSDHGEPMGEHDRYWFRDLYDQTLMVPLIVRLPASQRLDPAVIEPQVRLIDLAPTVLDFLGISSATPVDGSSLLPLMRGETERSPGPAQSALYYYPEEHYREAHAVRHDGWKLIRRGAGWPGGDGPWAEAAHELYHLLEDPEELEDRSGEAPGHILPELDAHITVQRTRNVELTPEERARLQGLGYVR